MPTLSREDLEQIIQIMREMIRQEIDIRLPIHSEIVDLTLVVKDLQKQVGEISHSLSGLLI